MKSNRTVGQEKSPPRFPIGALNTEHLSAVEAFERWQRESPRARMFASSDDRTTTTAKSRRALKN